MARITYSPAEELVIHEIVEVTKDDLLRERVTPQGTMPLYWHLMNLSRDLASFPQ